MRNMKLVLDDSKEFTVTLKPGVPPRMNWLPAAGAAVSAALVLAVIVRGKK